MTEDSISLSHIWDGFSDRDWTRPYIILSTSNVVCLFVFPDQIPASQFRVTTKDLRTCISVIKIGSVLTLFYTHVYVYVRGIRRTKLNLTLDTHITLVLASFQFHYSERRHSWNSLDVTDWGSFVVLLCHLLCPRLLQLCCSAGINLHYVT